MFQTKHPGAWVVTVFLAGLAAASARADEPPKPLSEAEVLKRVELLTDEELQAELARRGIGFAVDDAVLQRLRAAGASAAVLTVVTRADQSRAAAGKDRVVAYQTVLDLLRAGVDEAVILKRLQKSPTLFALDESQVEALKQSGASDRLLGAMQGSQPGAAAVGDVTDLVLILDCSGSMMDKTRDGRTKMQVAQDVVSELITRMPDGRRLGLIVYGHNAEQKCQAVKVVQELTPVDADLRRRLIAGIRQLRPVGHTPIALALRTAGEELAKAEGNSGLILITDGMETCHGDPNKEAAELAKNSGLTFGLHVIGFDVDAKELAAVEQVAKAGHGKFYNARSPEKLQEAVAGIREKIVAAQPAPVDENSPQIQALVAALKDKDGTVRRSAAEGLRRLKVRARPVVDALVDRVADNLWVPKPLFKQFNNACDPQAGGKAAALDALRGLAPDRVTEALQRAMKSANKDVRTWATGELTNLTESQPKSAQPPAQGPAMPPVLRGADPTGAGQRFKGYDRSQTGAGRSGSGTDPGPSATRGQIGGEDRDSTKDRDYPPALRAFVLGLTDGDGTVRKASAEAIGRMAPRVARAAVPDLIERVADDRWVKKGPFVTRGGTPADPIGGGKEAALETLRKLAPDQVTEALRKAQQSKNPDVRAWAIGKLSGP
jgi:Ca-activated chloride channel family protein